MKIEVSDELVGHVNVMLKRFTEGTFNITGAQIVQLNNAVEALLDFRNRCADAKKGGLKPVKRPSKKIPKEIDDKEPVPKEKVGEN